MLHKNWQCTALRLAFISCLTLTLTVMSHGLAQVSIKERVSLYPGSTTRTSIIQTNPRENYVVTPKSGKLRMVVGLEAVKDSTYTCCPNSSYFPRIPSSENLEMRVVFPGGKDTVYHWHMLEHVVSNDTGFYGWSWQVDNCGDNVFLYYRFLDFSPMFTDSLGAGDTLSFVYHSAFEDSARSLWISPPQIPWRRDITLQTYRCPQDTNSFRESLVVEVAYPETTVTFLAPDTVDVYPTYSPSSIHNATPQTRNYVQLSVKAMTDDSVARNTWLFIGRPILADSGGHTHNHQRPSGKYQVRNLPDTTWRTVDTVLAKTDTSGILNFRFLASQFGGIETVKARLASDTTKTDKRPVRTRVPNLRLLGTGLHYHKQGGTNLHHGPGGGGSYETPDTDHYGDSILIVYIGRVGDSVAHVYPTLTLEVNDLSLPYGGKFDLLGTWLADSLRQRHAEHRIGINADLPVAFMGGDTLKERKLYSIIKNVTTFEPHDETYYTPKGSNQPTRAPHPHFHMYSSNPAGD